MQYFIHIPIAVLNNLVFLGLGWVLYKLIEANLNFSAKALNIFASLILFMAAISFVLDIFLVNTVFDFIQRKIQDQLVPIFQNDLSDKLFFSLGLFYYLAILFLLFKMLIQFNKLYTLKSNADYSFSEKYKSIINDFSHLLPAKIKIGIVDNISSPMVFGITETIVLLPITLCNQLTTQEIKYILLHELAHVLRKDYFVNIFIEISKILMWFNPFSYLLINEIQLQREIDCDRFVIESETNPLHYSKTLLSIANFNTQEQNSLSMGAIGTNNQLLIRIKKLNGLDSSFNNVKFKFALLLVVIFTLFLKFNFNKNQSAEGVAENKVAFNNEKPLSFSKKNKEIDNHKSKLWGQDISSKPISKKQKGKQRQTISDVNVNDEYVQVGEIQPNESDISYSDILQQTKEWIKNHQSPALFANYNANEINKDSIDNKVANVLLLASIVKSYQLKRALLENQIHKTTNYNEANDYLMNSKEWQEVLQYEKWIEQFLRSQQ